VWVGLYWYDRDGRTLTGYAEYAVEYYKPVINSTTGSVTNACYSPLKPTASVSTTDVVVGRTVTYSLGYFPSNWSIKLYFDGSYVTSVKTGSSGTASGSFKLPSTTTGNHKLTWSVSSWSASRTLVVSPTISISPSSAKQGSTITVRLRGYKAGESVRIRWLAGSYKTITTVTMSSRGSKDVSIQVPYWSPVGKNSVRGDGQYGTARTTVFTTLQGPTPTPTKTATPKPTSTNIPTATATATATNTPTQAASSTPTAVPTSTSTLEPIEVSTNTPTATATATSVALSEGCMYLNDQIQDGYYSGSGFRGLYLAAGELITIHADRPTNVSPTILRLRYNWGVPDEIVTTEPFPGTINYVVPVDGVTDINWQVDAGNATWTVSCSAP
jgi:hypothetical protein